MIEFQTPPWARLRQVRQVQLPLRPGASPVTPQERLVAAHGPFTAAVMLARAETSCSPAQARRLLATLPARRASGSFPARGVAINAAVADPWCAATAFSRSLP